MMHLQEVETINGPVTVLVDGSLPEGVKGNDDPAAVRKFVATAEAEGRQVGQRVVINGDGVLLSLFDDIDMMSESEREALSAASSTWVAAIELWAGSQGQTATKQPNKDSKVSP